MYHKTLAIIALTICTITGFCQNVLTYEYAVKDTSHLKMDVYVPEKQNPNHPCMIYCFGGGFLFGSRSNSHMKEFQKYYNSRGWIVIAIDYRQGLVNYKNLTIASGAGKYKRAIEMAGEDLLSATNYILKNLLETPQFTINPSYIVTVGSSAGAITVLQADYFLANRMHGGELLPDTFRYAAVMSFSGAILTDNGKVKYRCHAPAPTLFCHGNKDHYVEYGQIWDFNLSLYGSKKLVKRFQKFHYPYYFRCYEGMGHEVAGYYRKEIILMDEFIREFVYNKKFLQINESYYDPSLPQIECLHIRPRDMRK